MNLCICDRCPLHKHAITVKVSSRGSDNPHILLIGEAPGKTEDEMGYAFVGRSGKNLDQYIQSANIPSNKVRFSNIVRCIPWNKTFTKVRRPRSNEIKSCISYLYEEILSLKPNVLVTLGNSSLKTLLDTKKTIGKARGKIYLTNIKHENHSSKFVVLPTYHPAAVLYGRPKIKSLIIRDLKVAWRLSCKIEKKLLSI